MKLVPSTQLGGWGDNLLHQAVIGDTRPPLWALCQLFCLRELQLLASVAPRTSGLQLPHSCFSVQENAPSPLCLHIKWTTEHNSIEDQKCPKEIVQAWVKQPVLIFLTPAPDPQCMQNSSCEIWEVICRVDLKLRRKRMSNGPKSTHLLSPVTCVLKGALTHSLAHCPVLLTALKPSRLSWALCPLYTIFPQIPTHVTQKPKLSRQLDRLGSVCCLAKAFHSFLRWESLAHVLWWIPYLFIPPKKTKQNWVFQSNWEISCKPGHIVWPSVLSHQNTCSS